MIRLSRAAENLTDLQRFKQVFFFRKPSRLKSIFATTKVANALTALPLWAAEIKDLSAVFPFELGLFDLVVVDEASQVNIAELIPCSRHKSGTALPASARLSAARIGLSVNLYRFM